ncbi:competence/damage-inducible protein A [bacterium]|nr:competence/damage-inducible protein A [bacterium]
MKAEIIIIGDEILNGTTLDTNSQFIARELEALNIEVIRRSTVKDRREEISQALYEAEQRADLIVTTGGLGPTKDDITKKTIAEYLDEELVMNEAVLQHVTDFFARRGRPMLDVNRLQALVPKSAVVLHNAMGTAPGTFTEKSGKAFVSMPGVPFEMRYIVENGLVPLLKERLDNQHIIHRYLHTVGVGESSIAAQIAEVEDALPAHIRLAYLPSPGIVKLRLTGTGDDEATLLNEMLVFEQGIKDILGPVIFGYGNETLSSCIGKLLTESGKTVGTAESCTSGYISQLLTQTPGSSTYFEGALVTYSYGLKEKLLQVNHEVLNNFGAVSEETILEMTRGGLQQLGVDYIMATSGIAGPGGGMPNKPVGTVWIAVGDKNKIISRKYQFGGDRTRNIELTSIMALDMLRRFILGIGEGA